MNTLSQSVTESIQQALKNPKEFVPLHEPRFSGNESKYVLECIDSTFVSSVGKFVDNFEKELADYTGAKHAVTVVNGTAALHMSLLLAGVEYGDEVLVPALSFVATANAVRYCYAKPHFVDSEERTLGIDPQALRKHLQSNTVQHTGICVNRNTGCPIRALIPVHITLLINMVKCVILKCDKHLLYSIWNRVLWFKVKNLLYFAKIYLIVSWVNSTIFILHLCVW